MKWPHIPVPNCSSGPFFAAPGERGGNLARSSIDELTWSRHKEKREEVRLTFDRGLGG